MDDRKLGMLCITLICCLGMWLMPEQNGLASNGLSAIAGMALGNYLTKEK